MIIWFRFVYKRHKQSRMIRQSRRVARLYTPYGIQKHYHHKQYRFAMLMQPNHVVTRNSSSNANLHYHAKLSGRHVVAELDLVHGAILPTAISESKSRQIPPAVGQAFYCLGGPCIFSTQLRQFPSCYHGSSWRDMEAWLGQPISHTLAS